MTINISPELKARILSLQHLSGAPAIYWAKMGDVTKNINKVRPVSPKHLPIGKYVIALVTDDGTNGAAYVYERKSKESFHIFMPIMTGSVVALYSIHHVEEDGTTIWQAETGGKDLDDVPMELIGEMVTNIPIELTKIGLLMSEGKVQIER